MHVIQRSLTLMLLLYLTNAQYKETCSREGQEGVCIRLGHCRYLMEEIKIAGSVAPLSDKLKSLQCGFNGKEPKVCCIENTATEESEIALPRTNRTFNMTQRISDGDSESSDIPDVSTHRNLKLLPTDCGPMDEDRIIRGKRVNLFEMPWMVLFRYKDVRSGNIQYKCGGTLISRRYVLTAAHCVTLNKNSFTLDHVVLGEHDVRTDLDCDGTDYYQRQCTRSFNHTVETTIVHPSYRNSLHGDDIALLKLKEPADTTLENISPICLPTSPELQKETLVGKRGVAAGWGTTDDEDAAPVLNSIGIPIISNDDCEAYFMGNPKISGRQLCTVGDEGQDTCTGDSGGPLAYPGSHGGTQKQVQRAIVSFGAKRCAVKGHPAVYTNLAYYMKWILDSIDE